MSRWPMSSDSRRDDLGLGERKFLDFPPFCAAGIKSSCNMKVDVPDRLARGFTVVLPHRNAGTMIGRVDGVCRVPNLDHQRSALDIR